MGFQIYFLAMVIIVGGVIMLDLWLDRGDFDD
jgi:hypothetical protein